MTKNIHFHKVKNSKLHGKGVFATKEIAKDTTIFEYLGDRITPEQADIKANLMDYDDPSHTFFFSIGNGMVIDGGVNGNDARFINHSCDPNCEAQEDDAGDHVYIIALRDIKPNEELTFDYGLIIDDEHSEELEQLYKCLCGSPKCRGTMMAINDNEDNQSESQHFDIRLSHDMIGQIDALANKHDISRNELIIEALESYLSSK